MSHLLSPSSDDEEEVPINKNKNKSQQQSSSASPAAATTVPQQSDDENKKNTTNHNQQTASSSAVRVAIEINDDDDDDDDDELAKEAEAAAAQQQQDADKKKQQNSQSSKAVAAAATTATTPSTTMTNNSGILPLKTGGGNDQYSFSFIDRTFPMCAPGGEKELVDLINKWGLGESMAAYQFSFEMIVDSHTYANSKSATVPGHVHAGVLPEFVTALMNSAEFQRVFRCGDGRGGKTLPLQFPSPVTSVKLKNLNCTATSLELFDRLVENNDIVRQHNGRVCNMADVFLPCGITVSDQFRGVFMLTEDDGAEHYDIYSDEERNEFLFHVMWRLASGGAVNQYEDEVEPYKNAARDVYKSLISVGRSRGDTTKLEVQSLVCAVEDVKVAAGGGGGSSNNNRKDVSVMKTVFFPKDDRTGNHNFLYVTVDPVRKTCCVWYNSFFSPF